MVEDKWWIAIVTLKLRVEEKMLVVVEMVAEGILVVVVMELVAKKH